MCLCKIGVIESIRIQTIITEAEIYCDHKYVCGDEQRIFFVCVYYGTELTQAKGHEPTLYKTLRVIVGLFSTFTFVKMKGPNKYY